MTSKFRKEPWIYKYYRKTWRDTGDMYYNEDPEIGVIDGHILKEDEIEISKDEYEKGVADETERA
jgi:hypothetical protein